MVTLLHGMCHVGDLRDHGILTWPQTSGGHQGRNTRAHCQGGCPGRPSDGRDPWPCNHALGIHPWPRLGCWTRWLWNLTLSSRCFYLMHLRWPPPQGAPQWGLMMSASGGSVHLKTHPGFRTPPLTPGIQPASPPSQEVGIPYLPLIKTTNKHPLPSYLGNLSPQPLISWSLN